MMVSWLFSRRIWGWALVVLVSCACASEPASEPVPEPATSVVPRPSTAVDRTYQAGRAAVQAGAYAEALALFDSTLAQDPAYGLAYLQQGLLYGTLRDWATSTAKYQAAVAVQPDLLDAWYNLGNNALRQQFYADAIAYYDTLLSLEERPPFWHNRGRASLALGRDADAKSAFERALALDSTYAFGHASLGALAEQNGDFHAMAAHYAAATRHAAEADEYWYKHGQAQLRLGDAVAARTALENALTINPYHTAAFFNRARLLQQQGDPRAPALLAQADSLRQADAAYQRLLRGIGQNPDNPRLHYQKGMHHVQRTEWDDARQAFQQVLFFDPSHVAAHTNLANTYLMLSQPEQAITTFQNVIERHPQTTDAYANLAIALMQQNRPTEARRVWEQLLAIVPNHPQALRALATLDAS